MRATGLLLLALVQGVTSLPAQTVPATPAGRWDLMIRDTANTFPGWLEIRIENGTPTGRLQWGWGHATPLAGVRVEGDRLSFAWPDEANPATPPSRGQGRLGAGGALLTIELTGARGETYAIRGRRAPRLDRNPRDTARWGEPIDLLASGLTYWIPRGEKNGWSYADGVLTNTMPSTDLISKLPLGDFKLHLEVKVPPQGNSGIYLRGRHELQVLDSHGKPPGSREMGGIYGQVIPRVNAARPAGEWQAYDLTFVGRRLSAELNGTVIHDFAEIPGVTGGALNSDEGAPGPLMLQGDHTAVQYRNIRVTPAFPADPAGLKGIRASEQSRFAAMMRADTAALRRLLAEELVYVHSNAQAESREHHLELIGSKRTVYERIEPVVMRYAFYGPSLAVGSGVVKAKGVLNGTPFDVILRVTTTHVWREGRWQMVTWQSTRMP
jgi:hypothetical protein